MKIFYLCIFMLCIILSGCEDGTTSIPPSSEQFDLSETPVDFNGNPYFFPDGTESVKVKCEMLILHSFKGEATLQVIKLSDTVLDNYYLMTLSALDGKCDLHDDTNDPECEFSNSFNIGYFYIDSNFIYLMNFNESYREIFAETDVFPPTNEYIDKYHEKLRAAGEHKGYFSCRLVCSEDGFEDTFGTSTGIDERYHNFISVNTDERRYNLWPETSGTQEHMYIFWKKDTGIVYYANWVGSLKDYIMFCTPSYEDNSIIDWIP